MTHVAINHTYQSDTCPFYKGRVRISTTIKKRLNKTKEEYYMMLVILTWTPLTSSPTPNWRAYRHFFNRMAK